MTEATMSEPTLYRELQPTIIEGIVDSFGVEAGDVAVCVEQIFEAQVPVERCEHGKVDGHDVPVDVPGVNKPLYAWCQGAGIGGSDDE